MTEEINTPADLVIRVLKVVSRDDWRNDPSALQELRSCLLGDPLDLQFEFFGVHFTTNVAEDRVGPETAEVIVRTVSLPYRAVLILDSTGAWKLREFLTQCTGCLGTGLIINRRCDSCAGTGWGFGARYMGGSE